MPKKQAQPITRKAVDAEPSCIQPFQIVAKMNNATLLKVLVNFMSTVLLLTIKCQNFQTLLLEGLLSKSICLKNRKRDIMQKMQLEILESFRKGVS